MVIVYSSSVNVNSWLHPPREIREKGKLKTTITQWIGKQLMEEIERSIKAVRLTKVVGFSWQPQKYCDITTNCSCWRWVIIRYMVLYTFLFQQKHAKESLSIHICHAEMIHRVYSLLNNKMACIIDQSFSSHILLYSHSCRFMQNSHSILYYQYLMMYISHVEM